MKINKIAEVVTSRSAEGAGGGFKEKLMRAKDAELETLKDAPNRIEFQAWLSKLALHCGSFQEWSGASIVLKKVQISQSEITYDSYNDILDDCEREARESDGKMGFFRGDWVNCLSKSRELYKLPLSKLNAKLVADASLIPGRNGFETLRQCVQSQDPTLENSDFAMGLEIQKLAFKRAKSLDETRQLITNIDTKAEDYLTKIGVRPDDKLLVRVLWEAMDEQSSVDAEKEKLDTLDTPYAAIKKFILKKTQRKLVRNNLRQSSSAMDVGHVGDGDGGDEDPVEALKRAAEKVKGEPLEDTEGLETFIAATKGPGKSKGNGKDGKPTLECWTCKGKGHPSHLCPTPKGSTASYTCSGCGGYGHNYPRCPSVHKPKGKGKDGSKGKDNYNGGKGKGDQAGGYLRGKGKGGWGGDAPKKTYSLMEAETEHDWE